MTDDGRYTIREREFVSSGGYEGGAFTYVKIGQDWKDYAVEVDISGAQKISGNHQWIGVIVRAVDDQNKIMFMNSSNLGVCWVVFRNGRYNSPCEGDFLYGAIPDQARVRVEAIGDTVTAYVNGVKRSILKLKRDDERLLQGRPGLHIWWNLGVTFDNFKVESLEDKVSALYEQPSEPAPPTEDPWRQWATVQLGQMDVRVNTLQGAVGERLSGISSVAQKVDILTGEMDSFQASVTDLRQEQTRIKDRVDKFEARLPSEDMDVRLAALQQRIEITDQKAERAGASAQLALLAGTAGIALALLLVLGVFR